MSTTTIIIIGALLIAVVEIGLVIGRFMMRGTPRQVSSARHPILGWVLAVIGCVGLMVALGTWLFTLRFTHAALHTNGTVIAMREETSSAGDSTTANTTTYAPTFRFRDAAGIEHVMTSNVYQGRGAFHVGDTVPILYLSANPQTARIDSFGQVWGAPCVEGIIGSGCLLFGLIAISRWRIVGWVKGQ